MAAVLNKGKR